MQIVEHVVLVAS